MARNLTILSVQLAASALLSFSCRQAPTTTNTQGPANPGSASPSTGVALLDANAPSGTAVGSCGTNYVSTNALPAYLTAINNANVIVTAPNDISSRLAVLSALSAVPKSLLQLFFVFGSGQIEIGDASTECKDTPLTPDERALFGSSSTIPACWHAPDNHEPLKLILNPDQNLIRGSLLRLFAYMETEYFVARVSDPTAPAPFNTPAWQNFINGFAATRTHLADAFLADLAAAGSANLGAMTQHNNSDPITFGNMVYANAVDSYYCSAATRSNLATTFKTVYKTMTDATNPYAVTTVLGD